MTLRLIKPGDILRTEHLIVCGYGLPDTGKSSLAFTCNKPLLIDFDGLVKKVGNEVRARGTVIQLDSWEDFENLEKQVDLSQFETIVIDTAGRLVDLLEKHVKTLATTNCQGDGNLSQKGWGQVKRIFEDRFEWLKKLGKDIVLLVHLKEDKSGEETLDRFDVDGSSKFEIYKSAEAIFRIVVTGKNDKRSLDFSPHEKSIGKNPGRLPLVPYDDPLTAPHTLANVLQQIKDYMNKSAAAVKPVAVEAAKPKLDAATVLTMQMQEKAQTERNQKRELFLAHYNPRIEELKKMEPPIARSIHEQAIALGLRYNKERNWYEPNPDAAENRTAVAGNHQGVDQGKPATADRGAGNDAHGVRGGAGARAGGSMVVAEGAGDTDGGPGGNRAHATWDRFALSF